MKFLGAFISMLTGISTACSGGCATGKVGFHPGYNSYVDQIEFESAVRLTVLCPNGDVFYGSGVAVSPRHVITAKHVIDCEGNSDGALVSAKVRNNAGISMVVDELSKSDAARLVVVGAGEPFKFWAEISFDPPRFGQNVCMVAGQLPDEHSLRKCGDVADYEDGNILISTHGVPGNSGSPFYNSDGQVVGITSMGKWASNGEFIILAVRSENFKDIVPEFAPKLMEGCVGSSARCKF